MTPDEFREWLAKDKRMNGFSTYYDAPVVSSWKDLDLSRPFFALEGGNGERVFDVARYPRCVHFAPPTVKQGTLFMTYASPGHKLGEPHLYRGVRRRLLKELPYRLRCTLITTGATSVYPSMRATRGAASFEADGGKLRQEGSKDLAFSVTEDAG